MSDETTQFNKLTTLSDITEHIRDINTKSLSVIQACTEQQYQHSSVEYSSIGTHIRHIIEVIKELNSGTDGINYDARPRDTHIEIDQSFASNQLNIEIKILLDKLKTLDLEQTITVNMDGICAKTTFGREVAVVISHTIHHLAFINLVAKQQNIKLDENIGIAPATLEYQANA